ncbi:MAG: alkaline phosphatase family protein [Bacteroidetes bacterium]|nr:alkaline phosphatase family protein [Bacteroidota bacterium]MBU1114428.1 alkaline phosphatase family protein [Bacteroidota bacterium]MBU1798831.1 alkaline phosphatase family protein [Bacteroidota bacterium]
MHSTLVIFLDGVGIGKNDTLKNPFFQKQFKFLNEIFGETPHLENQSISKGNKYIFPVDANMNVEGLPQSGTGQTSIFCGVNASKIVGRHFGPFPFSTLKPIIETENIFNSFIKKGLKVNFANAFPQIFFDYINSGRKRLNVTTLMALASDVQLFALVDLLNEKAISADITNRRWNTKMSYNIPIISPETAADRLLKITSENQFTLFEYFFTDHLGHGRNKEDFDILLDDLDRFLFRIISKVADNTTLLICSDHGNLENISVKGHTNNPTLTISAGFGSYNLMTKIKDLSQIKSALIDLY